MHFVEIGLPGDLGYTGPIGFEGIKGMKGNFFFTYAPSLTSMIYDFSF